MIFKEFSPDVQEKLEFYVYCLVDPRNGETFYIGKGIRNRVFQHVNATDLDTFYADAENKKDFKKTKDNEDPAKIQKIKEIRAADKEVEHIILRWGMNEQTAFEVEAALIDFVGVEKLTNSVRGYDTDRGRTNADELQIKYGAKKFDYNPDDPNQKFILIKIKDSSINLHEGTEEQKIFKAVRASWRININIANKYRYVLAVRNGIVRGVYQIYKNGWKKDPNDKDGKRACFDGEDAPEEIKEIFLYKKIPRYFVENQNPVSYSDSKKQEERRKKKEKNKERN